jgi:hypothetical protein
VSHPEKRGRSFAYLEILGALLACAVVSGSIYSIFVRQERSRQVGIELAEATQNARSGIDLLSRELRAAGYGADSSGTGADSSGASSIRTASQFRVTFTLDRNGDHEIEPGETVTYFLDPNRGDPWLRTGVNPRDYVLRRKVSTVDDPLAMPVPGTGEIVAYGLTQRTTSRAAAPDVPLFSYRSAEGEALERKPGTLEDRAGKFYGRTVSDEDLGASASGETKGRIQSVEVTVVTETRERNPRSGSYDRVRLAVSIDH